MSEKLKGIFNKLIDTTDKNHSSIHIDFVSNKDVQLNVIQKESKSAEINDEDNKALALLLSEIQSQFKQHNILLNRVQGKPEKKQTLTAGLKTDKASLSEAEVALQKMQLQAQELGAELVLTDRPAIMADDPWVLPELPPQKFRAADISAGEGLAKLATAMKTVTDKCPLQITLMIQPDLRPQVRVKVTASGGINWIFAAKEGRYPLKDLLAKMAGKTTTHGWDAVVVYQRGQANTLLKQQHIKRFITGNMLAPVNDDIESSTATRLLTHNLTLSAPHLSFNKAGTKDSTAQVAMDFVKGMIVYKEKAAGDNYRIMRIEKITPLNSPFVSMDVPLSKAPGSVSEIGEVQFDIKEGVHFTNNLVVNGMEQETISNFFKRRFDTTPEEQRVYKLGKFDNFENEQFQPEDFAIRTIAAPNSQSRGSQDEGDGAVVLFVKIKNSSTEPGSTEVDWLLGDDYTSALVISNYQLFDKMLRKPWEMGLRGMSFGQYLADADKAWKLQIVRGDWQNKFYFSKWVYGYPAAANVTAEVYIRLNFNNNESGNIPFTIRSSYSDDNSGDICAEYQFDGAKSYYNETIIPAAIYNYLYAPNNNPADMDAVKSDGSGSLNVYIKSIYNAVINDGIISFAYTPEVSSYNVTIDNFECASNCQAADKVGAESHMRDFQPELNSQFHDEIKSYAMNIRLNDISTFTLRNLLFPGENYFHADYARVPGDLLVMGKLGAGSESFSVTPTETTIVAGSDYQFKTTPEVSGVKWSISDSEKGNTGADLGAIDSATGKYTAPQAATVTEGVRHVVVCAEKGDTKVYALASVVAKGVSVSPAYQVVQPGKAVKLTANSVNGGELKWDMGKNKQGSSLTKVTNNEYTYQAGKKVAKLNVNLERVTVTDEKGASGEALILIPNSSMSGKITVSYDNVPADSVKLIYTVVIKTPELDEDGNQIYDEDDNLVFGEKEVELTGSKANWAAVETGGATFDKKTGILTSAPGVGDGFAVIRVTYTESTNQYRSAIVIPLPLSTYQKTILEAYSPEQ
ncbi:hypothetical protein ACISK3_11990 [Morganella morganii]|nr:hypothetical protein [Morganella morganii]